MTTLDIMRAAKAVAPCLLMADTAAKNNALNRMADRLIENTDVILRANDIDMKNAVGRISTVMLDRLKLTDARVRDMAEGIRSVAMLPDPVGRVIETTVRPNGLTIEKISMPMGVIGIIYESRPNVTSDAAALSIKSGSACVLRGGRDAYNSAASIVYAMKSGLVDAGLSPDLIQMVEDTSRASATEMMTAVGLIDLLIPRGGAGLIRACTENAKVPCIETGTGICHIYVDGDADIDIALSIIDNAKTSRPSVCNAAEVCLVNREIAGTFLPLLKTRLVDMRAEKGLTPVELRLDSESMAIIPGTPAGADDYDTEFLDYILAVHVVADTAEAVAHIAAHSTGHSEAIITKSAENAELFAKMVDSAAVYVNASTRFTDGGEFGLGCEMGISTQKLHARGPMGLNELTTAKYIIRGAGQIR